MRATINKAAVREYAIEVLKHERPALAAKFTRVGSEFFEAIEAATRNAIVNRVKSQCSSGKTLR